MCYVMQMSLKESFTDGGSTSVSHLASGVEGAHTDNQDTAESPPTAHDSAEPTQCAHGSHMTGAAPVKKIEGATAMEGVEVQRGTDASGEKATALPVGQEQSNKPEKVQSYLAVTVLLQIFRYKVSCTAVSKTCMLIVCCEMCLVCAHVSHSR